MSGKKQEEKASLGAVLEQGAGVDHGKNIHETMVSLLGVSGVAAMSGVSDTANQSFNKTLKEFVSTTTDENALKSLQAQNEQALRKKQERAMYFYSVLREMYGSNFMRFDKKEHEERLRDTPHEIFIQKGRLLLNLLNIKLPDWIQNQNEFDWWAQFYFALGMGLFFFGFLCLPGAFIITPFIFPEPTIAAGFVMAAIAIGGILMMFCGDYVSRMRFLDVQLNALKELVWEKAQEFSQQANRVEKAVELRQDISTQLEAIHTRANTEKQLDVTEQPSQSLSASSS